MNKKQILKNSIKKMIPKKMPKPSIPGYRDRINKLKIPKMVKPIPSMLPKKKVHPALGVASNSMFNPSNYIKPQTPKTKILKKEVFGKVPATGKEVIKGTGKILNNIARGNYPTYGVTAQSGLGQYKKSEGAVQAGSPKIK